MIIYRMIIDRWIDGKTDRQIYRQTYTDRLQIYITHEIYTQIDIHIDTYTDRYIYGQIDIHIDRYIYGQIDIQIDRQLYINAKLFICSIFDEFEFETETLDSLYKLIQDVPKKTLKKKVKIQKNLG